MTVGDTGLPRAAVPAAFDLGATAYDRMVGANPGYHDHLRMSARRMRIPNGSPRLLDAGCGTGASTAALLAAAPQAEIVAVDASEGMLRQARAKRWPSSVRFVQGRIEDLAHLGVDGPFDGIFAAYLIRNLQDPDRQLKRFRELLAPGGTLAIHEYSVRDSVPAVCIWNAVCWGIIIPSGWRHTRDTTLYRHLWRSVLAFDGAARVRRRLSDAGFVAVHSATVDGWQRNIVHTFIAQAPA